MDFLATYESQLSVGVAVGLIAVAAAYILFSSKKPKGSLYYTFASVCGFGIVACLQVQGCLFLIWADLNLATMLDFLSSCRCVYVCL